MKKLFLSHFSDDAKEVHQLAHELRFRGVVPWVDKVGGFAVADDSVAEARRAIREDCFGLLLYATPEVFGRTFVTSHEIAPAVANKEANPSFMLFAVPRGLSFSALKQESEKTYGHDMSKYHTHGIMGTRAAAIQGRLALVAGEVLRKVVADAPTLDPRQELAIQFSSWESVSASNGELLLIDGCSVYRDGRGAPSFERLLAGMRDVKREVARCFGRPVLRVEGSKHLSAAFAFGRVFQPFEMNIRQTPDEYWRSDLAFRPGLRGFSEKLTLAGSGFGAPLVIEISSRYKELSDDADKAVADLGPFSRLVLRPDGEEPLDVDNELCCALADQAYHSIEKAVNAAKPSAIHLFSAAPQALMMMLGRKFAGMKETHAHDFREGSYGPPRTIPGGVL